MEKLGLIVLLVLCTVQADAAELPPAPSLGPEGEVAANPPDDAAKTCMEYLGLIAERDHEHVDRTLISANRRWGLVLRADVSAFRDGTVVTWRYVCPISLRGPVQISFELNVPPLTSGSWGTVRTSK